MNTIFIICDTWRRDHCTPYNQGRPLNECGSPEQPSWTVDTPNLSRLADRGTVFDNCWSGSYPTMPARRDIFTGRLEFLERGWGPLEEWDLDLAHQISGPVPGRAIKQILDEGHLISYLITDDLNYWGPGSAHFWNGFTGFELIRGNQEDAWYTDPVEFPCPEREKNSKIERYFRNVHLYRKTEADETCAQIFTRAADWLRHNHTYENFHLHLDSFAPHEPWDPPEEMVKKFDPKGYNVEGWTSHPPYSPWREVINEEQLVSHQARYAAKVELVDKWIGKLFDAMDELDLWKNTLVIFTTDHATFNGDHGRIGKNQTHCHDALGHIPFIAAHPTAGHGERRDQLVQLMDVYSTVLSAMDRPIPEKRHAVNILPAIKNSAQKTRDYALVGSFGNSVTMTDGRWVLHQAPVPDNKPLFWYGYSSGNMKRALGPVIDGRREATKKAFPTPTWLSDRANDPSELTNLAESEPAKLKEMQQALIAELKRLEAPKEQLKRLGLA